MLGGGKLLREKTEDIGWLVMKSALQAITIVLKCSLPMPHTFIGLVHTMDLEPITGHVLYVMSISHAIRYCARLILCTPDRWCAHHLYSILCTSHIPHEWRITICRHTPHATNTSHSSHTSAAFYTIPTLHAIYPHMPFTPHTPCHTYNAC